MDFVTSFSISTDWKKDNNNSIFIIVNQLTKIVYYNPVKINIDVLKLAKFMINMGMHCHGLLDSIVTNRGLFFNLKF